LRTVHLGMVVCILAAVMTQTCCAQKSAKVRVLYTGEPYPGVTPYVFMKAEPLIQATPVVASRDYMEFIIPVEEIKRAVRLYMPRNYDSLVQGYDAIIISDSNVGSFTDRHLQWFRDSVKDGGLGLVMVGGHETFGTLGSYTDWGTTPVGEVLPVDTILGAISSGRVTITEPDHEFIKSVPLKDDLPFFRLYSCNIVKPREGAQVLAKDTLQSGTYAGWKNPFFSTWDPGEGRAFAFTGDWQYGWGVEFIRWEYAPDFAINLMLYLARRPLPQDLNMVHTLRARMMTLSYRTLILSSLMDFVERFGANPSKISSAVGKAGEAAQRVSDLYMEERFDEALDATDEALRLMDEADGVADRVKADALFWIYISEWFIVTGAFLVCGVITWTLMIRRRLYKEVGMTQFRTG